MEWIFVAVLLLLSGFFSGSEIAFVTASKLKLDLQSRKDTSLGRSVLFFLKHPERFLTVTLVGNNIVNVAYATLMAISLEGPLNNWIEQLSGVAPGPLLILSIQTVIASFLIMFLGEILPKAIFRVHADFFIRIITIPQHILYVLLFPLVWIADYFSGLIQKILPGTSETDVAIYHRADLVQVFQELKDTGAEDLDKEDTEILHNVLELYTKRVKEVMVPRTDIIALDQNASINEVLETFVRSGHSKLPIYNENLDDIVGVVFAYDLFAKPTHLKEVVREVKMVPSSMRTKDLLSDFQTEKITLAIVLDEYGGTAGLITIEDLLEEVVGDIQDEYDRETFNIKKLSETEFVIDAGVELEDLREEEPLLPWPEKSDEYETMAGFVIHIIGRLPKVNEEIKFDGFKLIISRATPSRIKTVKLILTPS